MYLKNYIDNNIPIEKEDITSLYTFCKGILNKNQKITIRNDLLSIIINILYIDDMDERNETFDYLLKQCSNRLFLL